MAASPLWEDTLQRSYDDACGRWTMDQAFGHIMSGSLDVWTVTDEKSLIGVFTTRVIDSKERWILVEDLAGSRIDDWLEAADAVVEEWARGIGATQILAEGRQGWKKKLKALGYKCDRIQAMKRINPETMQ